MVDAWALAAEIQVHPFRDPIISEGEKIAWHRSCFSLLWQGGLMENQSIHAKRRCAQRQVHPDHIELALKWGQEIHQPGGRTAYHLGHQEVQTARALGVEIPESAWGVAVVIAADDTIVTVVRSSDRKRLRTHRQRTRRHR